MLQSVLLTQKILVYSLADFLLSIQMHVVLTYFEEEAGNCAEQATKIFNENGNFAQSAKLLEDLSALYEKQENIEGIFKFWSIKLTC